jgi:extracellular factor (EF) 3-hydroxypalmitic acid methyl ester biosynthesis protein
MDKARHLRPFHDDTSGVPDDTAHSIAGAHAAGSEGRWPDELALDSLKQAAAAFERLTPDGDHQETYAKTVAAVHALCAAIANCEETGVERNEILAHLAASRAIHHRSPFAARVQEWPRGYPGDFETVEYLCDAVNRAEPGTVEHAIEAYALASPIAQQHRNKVAFQAGKITDAWRRTGGRPRILTIGCGGCRDLRSLAPEVVESNTEFVLCDLDENALDFALHHLGPLAERSTYLNAMIPRVLRRLLPYGPFDLAIAGGLFDYLPDRWITLSIRELTSRLLKPGGSLIFTNINRGNPYRVWLEYLANWSLIERDEQELRQLCLTAGMKDHEVDITRDATGLALLVQVSPSPA